MEKNRIEKLNELERELGRTWLGIMTATPEFERERMFILYKRYKDLIKQGCPEIKQRLDDLRTEMSRIIADAEYINEDTLDAESEAKIAPVEDEIDDLTNKLYYGGVR